MEKLTPAVRCGTGQALGWSRDPRVRMLATLAGKKTRILRVPAPLLCYWMGSAEQQEAG